MSCRSLPLIVAFLVFYLGFTQGEDYGVRIRITAKALQYADEVSIQRLVKSVQTANIKDVTGSAGTPIGSIDYEIRNIRVTAVSIQASEFKPVPAVGLQLKASGIYVAVSGDWHYRKRHWPHVSDSGSVDVSAQDTSFSLSVKVGADPNTGRPTMSPADCSSDVGSVHVKFHGGASWLYNLFSSSISRAIRKTLQETMCKSAAKFINDDVSGSLATFEVKKKIDRWAYLNYRLVQPPLPTENYMDVFLKGSVESIDHPFEPKIKPDPLPQSSASGKMAYIWISDYLAKTAGEVYTKAGRLSGVITPDMIPEKSPFKLNTATFKSLIPKLYELYPNDPMVIKVNTDEPPQLNTDTSGMNLTGTVNLQFGVIPKDDKVVDVFLLQLYVETIASVQVKCGRIIGQTKFASAKVTKVKSEIGDIKKDIPNLKRIIEIIGKLGLVKVLNHYLSDGIPLPSIKDMDFVNTEIITGKHFVLLSTDLRYVPDLERVRDAIMYQEMKEKMLQYAGNSNVLSKI